MFAGGGKGDGEFHSHLKPFMFIPCYFDMSRPFALPIHTIIFCKLPQLDSCSKLRDSLSKLTLLELYLHIS